MIASDDPKLVSEAYVDDAGIVFYNQLIGLGSPFCVQRHHRLKMSGR